MQFDFRELYASYSNAQLLLIVTYPEKYTPEAVVAARELLSARETTSADLVEMKELLSPAVKVIPAADTKWKINAVSGLTGVAGLFYFFSGLASAGMVQDPIPGIEWVLWALIVMAMLAGSLLFCLRKRWGWILISFIMISAAILLLAFSIISVLIDFREGALLLIPCIIPVLFLRTLLQRDIRIVYHVQKRDIWCIVLAAIAPDVIALPYLLSYI